MDEGRFSRLFAWLRSAYTPERGEDAWTDLAKAFLDRWIRSGTPDHGNAVYGVIMSRPGTELQIRYWEQIEKVGPHPSRIAWAGLQVFQLLLREASWSRELQERIATRIPGLRSADTPCLAT